MTRLDCGLARHRREPRRRALLRRGRGLLAEALRDLGPARRAAAGADRLLDRRRESRSASSCRRCSRRSARASIARAGARARRSTPTRSTRTVARVQRAVRPGTFDHARARRLPRPTGSTPPKTHWARPIDTPPFCGYPLRPGITFTYLGVEVDERARVLMANGEPAANMFAAGEIMAGNILGQGYVAGVGMTIGTVFGRIAGEEAARACWLRLSAARRGGAARDGGLQRLPLLRRLLRRCSRRWSAGSRSTKRDLDVPRQPLPQLRRVPLRVPVRAAARVRHQRAADAGGNAARIVRGVLLARGARPALFRHHSAAKSSALAAGSTVVLLAIALMSGAALWPAQAAGDFYAVVPHGVMVALFGLAGVFAMLALSIGFVRAARSFVASGFSRTPSVRRGSRDATDKPCATP